MGVSRPQTLLCILCWMLLRLAVAFHTQYSYTPTEHKTPLYKRSCDKQVQKDFLNDKYPLYEDDSDLQAPLKDKYPMHETDSNLPALEYPNYGLYEVNKEPQDVQTLPEFQYQLSEDTGNEEQDHFTSSSEHQHPISQDRPTCNKVHDNIPSIPEYQSPLYEDTGNEEQDSFSSIPEHQHPISQDTPTCNKVHGNIHSIPEYPLSEDTNNEEQDNFFPIYDQQHPLSEDTNNQEQDNFFPIYDQQHPLSEDTNNEKQDNFFPIYDQQYQLSEDTNNEEQDNFFPIYDQQHPISEDTNNEEQDNFFPIYDQQHPLSEDTNNEEQDNFFPIYDQQYQLPEDINNEEEQDSLSSTQHQQPIFENRPACNKVQDSIPSTLEHQTPLTKDTSIDEGDNFFPIYDQQYPLTKDTSNEEQDSIPSTLEHQSPLSEDTSNEEQDNSELPVVQYLNQEPENHYLQPDISTPRPHSKCSHHANTGDKKQQDSSVPAPPEPKYPLYQVIANDVALKAPQIQALLDENQPVPSLYGTPWERSGLFEGDIVLDSPGLRNVIIGSTNYWTMPVPVHINDADFGEVEIQQIREAITEIERKTCVVFREYQEGDQNYIIVRGDQEGCWSSVGMKEGGQTLHLQVPSCMIHGTIVHEFLHALGLYHQQSTFDRDRHVAIHYENIKPEYFSNFNKYKSEEVTNAGQPYDYRSVMHYSDRAFSKNGEVTVDPLVRNVEIGQRRGMSQIDIKKIQWIYCKHMKNNTKKKPRVKRPPQFPHWKNSWHHWRDMVEQYQRIQRQYEKIYQPYQTIHPLYDKIYHPYQAMRPQYDKTNQPYQTIQPQYDKRNQPYQTIQPQYDKRNQPYQTIQPQYDKRNQPYQTIQPQYDKTYQPYQTIQPQYDKTYQPYDDTATI